jgi:hypothetical protein
MKDLSLLVWLTQLGLSVALPLAGCVMLALWLRGSLGWGNWVIWVGVIFGIVCAIHGFLSSLRTLRQLTENPKKDPPPVSFNEHQ